MSVKQHVRGQIFGYKELPNESGLWGVLLPKPGEKAVAHEPDAQDVIERIDSDRLIFGNSVLVGNRGFLFALCLPMILVFLSWLLWLCLTPQHPAASRGVGASLYAIVCTIGSIFAFVAFRAARAPLQPPTRISRKLRKVYFWNQKSKAWVVLDYDGLAPATFVHRVATTSGAFTSYVLVLCQLKPGTREIEYAIAPAVGQTRPEGCGQIWEFIRRYMDSPPHALPAVRLLPSGSAHPKAWMARSDRAVFVAEIDDQHRIKRDLFSIAVVWFWGSLGYWWERAAGWIERTAPRRPLPPELQAAEAAPAENPYRIVPPTDIEQQAQAGTLPYMRRRWFICGVVSTLIWGWLFGLLAVSIWVMDGKPSSRGFRRAPNAAVWVAPSPPSGVDVTPDATR